MKRILSISKFRPLLSNFSLLLPVFFLLIHSLSAQSTINDDRKFAHGANIGWINFKYNMPTDPDGVMVGDYFLWGYAYSANCGWINFGSGSPANGISYANNAANDFGVNHDGRGNLTGYAYGANIGWISFDWTDENDYERPRIDLTNGIFHGFAYSANVGWINLGSDNLKTDTIAFVDSDTDGISDAWELSWMNNLVTANATSDHDHDDTIDFNEFVANTNPNDSSDYLKIESITVDRSSGLATVNFTSSPDRFYRIETSSALGVNGDTWNPSGFEFQGTAGTDATIKTISIDPETDKFIRVIALRPLSD